VEPSGWFLSSFDTSISIHYHTTWWVKSVSSDDALGSNAGFPGIAKSAVRSVAF
jgi:hypothetical protein